MLYEDDGEIEICAQRLKKTFKGVKTAGRCPYADNGESIRLIACHGLIRFHAAPAYFDATRTIPCPGRSSYENGAGR